jgi:hypothetical protein
VLTEFVTYSTLTDPIDRSGWRLRSRAVGRSLVRWSLGPSSAACITSTNEPPEYDPTFAALQVSPGALQRRHHDAVAYLNSMDR